MIRLLTLCLALLPNLLRAECGTANIVDQMSDAQRAEMTIAAEATAYGEGLFWRATKGDRRIDLVGTIHIPDPRLDGYLDRALPDLADADLLLVEAGPDEQAQLQNAMFTTPDLIFINSGPTIADMLPEEDWLRLRKAASGHGIPAPLAAKMQPWFLALTLSIPGCAMQDLATGAQGLDNLLQTAALDRGIPVQALEPWDTVFGLFREDSMEQQLDMLLATSSAPDLAEAAFVGLREFYFKEKIAHSWEMGRIAARMAPGLTPDEADATFAEMERDLLITRNADWMPVINDASATHPHIMIAAGAAHLQGDHGVLAKLADQGWALERR